MAKTIGSFDLASLKNLRDDVTQYFWFESNSSSAWGSGAHVTLYPESQFTNPSHANYMKGQNIIMNTDGFSIRNGALPMMVLDNDSLDFNVVDTSLGTYTTVATFGSNGAVIGEVANNKIRTIVSPTGMVVRQIINTNVDRELGAFGYGDGYDGVGSVSSLPYYTIGFRKSGTNNYSNSTTYYAGDIVVNNGTTYVCVVDKKLPGNFNADDWAFFRGGMSCVEGSTNVGAGWASHTEGAECCAIGKQSHAEGWGTVASSDYQHVGGKYNAVDIANKYAFIIGKGTSKSARSNAFTIDWNGAARLAGNLFTGCNADSTGGYEFGQKASDHIVVGGIHICWGRETISHSGSGYLETEVTLPYTYTSTPYCFASYSNRPTGGAARTAYATHSSSQALNKIYVGSYATASVTAYVNWMTIGA